jgi:hypothetical protein
VAGRVPLRPAFDPTFDRVFSSTDPDEAQRPVALGRVGLHESQIEAPGKGPSGEHLVPGIEGLRVGAALGHEASGSVTSYVVGYLKDAADGQPAE